MICEGLMILFGVVFKQLSHNNIMPCSFNLHYLAQNCSLRSTQLLKFLNNVSCLVWSVPHLLYTVLYPLYV